MSDHTSNVDVQMGTERNFGIVFAVVFLIIGLFPLWGGGEVRWWAVLVAAAFVVVAFVAPAILKWPNRLWFKFGMLLGAIIAPIVMGLVFITTFVTIGIVMRLLGKDLLSQKLDPSAKSYWITRETPPQPMKNQF